MKRDTHKYLDRGGVRIQDRRTGRKPDEMSLGKKTIGSQVAWTKCVAVFW